MRQKEAERGTPGYKEMNSDRVKLIYSMGEILVREMQALATKAVYLELSVGPQGPFPSRPFILVPQCVKSRVSALTGF